MQELLSAVERNAMVTRKRAIKALSVLDTAEDILIPLQYQQVMGALSDLLPLWVEHMRLLSQAGSLISRETGHKGIAVFREFEEELADTASSLEIASSAGWARTPALGVNALRLRVAATLRSILCQMEKEQTTVIPLLRRIAGRSVQPVPIVKQMAAA
jgi:hypothetical protein